MVSPTPFDIKIARQGPAAQLVIVGEIDLSTCTEIVDAVERLAEHGCTELKIDLRNVSFMDSSGLRALLLIHRQFADEGRQLTIVPATEPVMTVFRLTGADTRLPFVHDE
jgi:anti-anti-sigma factor